MSTFDFGDTSDSTRQDGDEPVSDTMRVSATGEYATFRIVIPKEIVEKKGIESGDVMAVTETEDGFEAETIDV